MLVGPSGCGKTTLISIIAAILEQDSGECDVLGQDLKGMEQREKTRFRGSSIGFVFQLFNLLPSESNRHYNMPAGETSSLFCKLP